MNIRVKPTVRCTFDAEEGVVRLVLKESVGSQEAGSEAQSGAKEPTQEVVIYALKARTVRLNPRASPLRIFLAWKVMLEAGLQGVCRVAFAELALQTSQNRYVNNIIISLGVLVRHTRQPGLLFHPPAGLELSARFHTMSLAFCFRFHFLRRVSATTNHYLGFVWLLTLA